MLSSRVPKTGLPDFIVDPPAGAHDRILCMWLDHLGEQGISRQTSHQYMAQRLAAILGISLQEVHRIERDACQKAQHKSMMIYFDSVPHEVECRRLYERLAHVTARFRRFAGIPTSTRVSWGRWISDELNRGMQGRGGRVWRSARLARRWAEWDCELRAMIARNPRLQLTEALSQISESHLSSSWPIGWEERIQDWADAGTLEPVPFIDHHGIVTPEFYDRLRELRTLSGGWFYYNEDVAAVVFASEPDWQKVRRSRAGTRGPLVVEVMGHDGRPELRVVRPN